VSIIAEVIGPGNVQFRQLSYFADSAAASRNARREWRGGAALTRFASDALIKKKETKKKKKIFCFAERTSRANKPNKRYCVIAASFAVRKKTTVRDRVSCRFPHTIRGIPNAGSVRPWRCSSVHALAYARTTSGRTLLA